MIGYLNDKDGYQVYMPSLNKIVHCLLYTSSQNKFASVQRFKRVWKMQLWKTWLWRKGMKMTQCQIRHSQSKPQGWRPRKFSRNTGQIIYIVKRPMWMTSGDYIRPSARTTITGSGESTSYWEAINSVGYSREGRQECTGGK
jgi:hypothetical protein